MLYIKKYFDGHEVRQDISVTRGDSFTLTVDLVRKGMHYTLEDDDQIRVAISEGYVGDFKYKLIYSAPISKETLTFTVPADVTKRLQYKPYCYDVEITHGNGDVDTVTKGALIITGESQ